LNGLQRGRHVTIALLETLLNAMWIASFKHSICKLQTISTFFRETISPC